MKTQPRKKPPGRKTRKHSLLRRGSVIVLVSVMLVVFLILAAMSIDVAFMQLVRAELRAASDAAAMAGAESLSREQDGDSAVNAAITTAALNRVAGVPMQMQESDVELGRSDIQADGTWEFTPGAEPYNAVRATGRRTDSNPAGTVSLFLGGIFGRNDFAPVQSAVASQLDQDIVLVVDRSHSMCWDMSSSEWSYPPGTANAQDTYCEPPDATDSRWAKMEVAVDAFVDALEETHTNEKLGLATFASAGTWCSGSYDASTRERNLVSDYSRVTNRLGRLGRNPMPGGTDISAGMTEGASILTGNRARPYAQKTMILLTDGQWNSGVNPTITAQTVFDQGIKIYTITFSDQADQATMQTVATTGGGKHYHASDAESLIAIYREIAFTLPVVLTK